MLTDLSIKNIAIIDTLHISFRQGLTILTGETGAGKSIIIDAVGLIMGGRASNELIRHGEEEASVTAIFDVSALPDIKQQLLESGFSCDEELLIKRTISRSGKNRIFINGSMATLALLTEISARLINIYGQHESQTLLKPDNHLRLLDTFGGITGHRDDFAQMHARLRAVQQAIENLNEEERTLDRRIDLLSYQTDEIGKAALREGEEEELEECRQVLANSEKLGGISGEAFERLYGGDGAILGQLRRISSSITELAGIDRDGLSDAASSIEAAYLQLEDAAITLRDYASRIDCDPATLSAVEDRLDLITRLKKKYGPSVSLILAHKEEIDGELNRLRGREQDKQNLETEFHRLSAEVQSKGMELSAFRKAAAISLKGALEKEAHQLAMKDAVIDVVLETLAEPRSSGFERVEFMFSPNPGELPRPLAKIASGGELSRLMLAVKQILPEGDVPTLVFDEVDSGIGGATSELVGRKLRNVANRQQVLCITHLPQVAVFADQHLRVEKQVVGGRTSTHVVMLDQEQRTQEIARMLAGARITGSALTHAAEMLAATALSGTV